MKSDNIFFPRYFQYFLLVECFSCFFLSQANIADFEIITFNVKGLGSFEKRRKVFNYLKKHTTQPIQLLFFKKHILLKQVKQSEKLSGVVK